MSEKRCYSIGDIQEILGICKTTAYNLIKENQFRTVLIGGKYRISKKSFDAWLDGEMTEPEPEQNRERVDLGGAEKEEDLREQILNRYTLATRWGRQPGGFSIPKTLINTGKTGILVRSVMTCPAGQKSLRGTLILFFGIRYNNTEAPVLDQKYSENRNALDDVRRQRGLWKMEEKKWISVAQMGELLGLKKTERYWLVHKHYFETKQIRGKIMVDISSFEKWYANQVRYQKVYGTEPGLELRKRSYSARDISILLDIHEQTAYELINRTGLKTILVDGWKRVPRKEFDAWFNTQSRYTLHDFSRVTQKENESHSSDPEETASKGTGNSHIEDEEATSPVADVKQTTTSIRKCPSGYCSRREAAMLAGVSELTIIHWAEKGHFPQRKVGNKVFIPKEEFSTWMKYREEGESADGIAHNKKREV